MNKYRQAAWKVAGTVRDLMNLMYKSRASAEFRVELIAALRSLEYAKGRWEFKKKR